MSRAVLTFHAIDERAGALSYPPGEFAALLEGLRVAGVPIVPFDELQGLSTGVTITFDDGMKSVHDAALPVLRDLGCPAHLFLATAFVGATNDWPGQPAIYGGYAMLDWADVERCAAGGIRIDAHTHSHPDLRRLDAAALEHEFATSDALVASRVGATPRLFAYPYGWHDARVRAAAGGRYEACMTTRLDYLDSTFDAAAVPRLDACYLRADWLRRRPLGRVARGYLAARAVLRRLRGHE